MLHRFVRSALLLAVVLFSHACSAGPEYQFSDEELQRAAALAVAGEDVDRLPLIVTRVQPWATAGDWNIDQLVIAIQHMQASVSLEDQELESLAREFLLPVVYDRNVTGTKRHIRVSPVVRQGPVALVECSTYRQFTQGTSTLVLLATRGDAGRPELVADPLHDAISVSHFYLGQVEYSFNELLQSFASLMFP